MANQYMIQPETFEFQSELDEYENTFGEFNTETGFGEMEGSFGEQEWELGQFEGGQFEGGQYEGGPFETGQFEGGQFEAGPFEAGQFEGVQFEAGQFEGGQFEAGQFEGGPFEFGFEVFESGFQELEAPPVRRGRGPNFLRPSRGKRVIRGPGARQGEIMGEIGMESEVGFDSPTRAPRPVRASFVNCNTASPAVTAVTGADPVGAITRANTRAIQLLDSAINQLQTSRARVRGGAAPTPPAVSAVIRQSLQRRFGMNAGDRALWTSTAARSALTVIRRLRGARQILADGWMKYTCLGPSAPATVTLGSGSNTCTVVGCEGEVAFTCGGISRIVLCGPFWRDASNNPQSLDFQATTLLHECVHIYFGFIADSGNFANAHCYEQLVMDLNGLAVPANFQASCPTL